MPRSSPSLTLPPLAVLLLTCGACETEIRWIDPPVHYTVDHRTCGDDGSGSTAETGIYEEQIFNAFSVHSEAPISKGVQGGTWLMPALRTTGIRNPVRLRATLTTAKGELVGTTVIANTRLKVSPDDACEILALPIPVLPASPLNDKQMATWLQKLYDSEATLKIEVESREEGGGKAVGEAVVQLVKG